MKKLLLLTSILMLVLGLSTVSFAAKEMFLRDPISKIEVTIPPVYDGKTQIKKEDITLSKGLEISSMSWTNVTGHAFMTDNETYRNKSVYSVRIYLKTTSGYKFADTVEATVNGKKVEDPFEYEGKRVVDAEFTE